MEQLLVNETCFNASGLQRRAGRTPSAIRPTSPLGDRWFMGWVNQIPLSLPSPGPPIRRVWITRGLISFSADPRKRPARAPTIATLNKPSSVCQRFVVEYHAAPSDCVWLVGWLALFFTFAALPAAGQHRPSLPLPQEPHWQARGR